MWPFGLFQAAHYAAADSGWLCKSGVRHCAPCHWKFLWYAIKCRGTPRLASRQLPTCGILGNWSKMKPNEIDQSVCGFWPCASRWEVIQLEDQRQGSRGRELRYVRDVWGAGDRDRRREVEKETIDQAKLCCLSIRAFLQGVEWHEIGRWYLLVCVPVRVCLCVHVCACVFKARVWTSACVHICTLGRVALMGF